MTLISSISGVRGTIGGKPGNGLTPDDIVKFSAAFASWLKGADKPAKVVIGRDARPSGQMVNQLVCGTLMAMGVDVVDLGLATTPTVEMAVPEENAGGGIILTASHNPVQWNALKLLNEKGEFISADEGETLMGIINEGTYEYAKVEKIGTYSKNDSYLEKHIKHILQLPLVDKEAIKGAGFKIVLDCVNSVGGIAVPALLKALGIEQVVESYCEADGRFPHNPEPLPENLSDLAQQVRTQNADLGIAVDPDVDRLALVSEDGSFFGEEYTLVAVADYILQNNPGTTISNLSSSRALTDVTEKYGQKHYQSAVGEVNVVEMMKEKNAVIGGEGNGGIIYPELHYGRDALVGIALFLTHLAKSGKNASQLRASYPDYYINKNKITLEEGTDTDRVLKKMEEQYDDRPINTTDGVKIEFDKDWVHLRRSNTEPIIRIYTESESQTTAENLSKKIMHDIKSILQEK